MNEKLLTIISSVKCAKNVIICSVVSIVVKFFIYEISFWSKYVASFVKVMPIFLNFIYILLELVSLIRLCVFMLGCMVFLKVAYTPKDNIILQPVVIAPQNEIMIKHKVGPEGISLSFSKEGIALDEVTKITKAVNQLIPDTYLSQAMISTKVLEENKRYKFSECYISGLGFKVYVKSVGDDIILEWMQNDSKNIIAYLVKGSFKLSVLDKLPKNIAEQVSKLISEAKFNSANIAKIQIGYQSYSEKGKMPQVKFLRLDTKLGQSKYLLSHKNKLYDPHNVYSYNDLVQLGRPVIGRVSSNYGWRMHPVLKINRMHRGIDYAAALGTPIRAVANGTVLRAIVCKGYGNFVEISHTTHNAKMTTAYAHLTKLILKKNQRIKKGDIIGYVGNTGITTSAHLHYEMKVNGNYVHPHSIKSFYKRISADELKEMQSEYTAYKRKIISI